MLKQHVRTDFSQYSHQQLWAMLYASDPATVREAADRWDAVGQWLHTQAGDLDHELSDFDTKWSGGAAAQYHSMMGDLSGGIRTVADNAWAMRDNAHGSADALETARAQMPPPVEVPEVSPTTMSLASTPMTVDSSTSPAQAAAMQQQQAQAAAAVQQQQQAQSQATAAHAQAVKVMTTLADHYTVDEDTIPETPSASGRTNRAANGSAIGAGLVPGLTTGGPAIASITGADGLPISGVGTDAALDGSGLQGILPGRTGVFGGMFAAGLAAASAASLGRFGSVLPRVPAFASSGSAARKQESKDAAANAAAIRAAGIGGGGTGAGLGGVGVSTADPSSTDDPTAYQGMASGGSSLSNGLTAAAAAAPIAARAGMGGFMPAMPYGAGMGGGDNSGTKRIPPWLVETEDVWGESNAVSPTVIGEEPPADKWLG